MYFLTKYGLSPAPLVLGIILGPIAESNYVKGSIIAEAGDGLFSYFFTGTLNLFLITLVVASIVYSVVSEIRIRRLEPRPGVAS